MEFNEILRRNTMATIWYMDGVHSALVKSKAKSFKTTTPESAIRHIEKESLRYHDGVPISIFWEDKYGIQFFGLGIYASPHNYVIRWDGIDAVRKLRFAKR